MVVGPRERCSRVGAHNAVVWNRLKRKRPAANRSAVGVRHGPPNVLDAPNPTSSNSTINTFGAPAGGNSGSIGANAVSGSLASYVVNPGAGRSGIGNIVRGATHPASSSLEFPSLRRCANDTAPASLRIRSCGAAPLPRATLGPVAVDGPTGPTVIATRNRSRLAQFRSVRGVSHRFGTPRDATVELDLEREAEERSHQHDQRKRQCALERGVDRDRLDDVGDDQDFQSEQDRSANVLACSFVRRATLHASTPPSHRRPRRRENRRRGWPRRPLRRHGRRAPSNPRSALSDLHDAHHRARGEALIRTGSTLTSTRPYGSANLRPEFVRVAPAARPAQSSTGRRVAGPTGTPRTPVTHVGVSRGSIAAASPSAIRPPKPLTAELPVKRGMSPRPLRPALRILPQVTGHQPTAGRCTTSRTHTFRRWRMWSARSWW